MKKMRLLVVLLMVVFGMAGTAVATTKKKVYATLVSARKAQVQAANGQMKTSTNLVIVWKGSAYPESFFWRGENGWLPCRIQKYKKAASTSEADHIDIDNNQVHKGDTLLLIPTPGGKFAVPAEIPATAKNTLYFKTGGSKWQSLKVGKVK